MKERLDYKTYWQNKGDYGYVRVSRMIVRKEKRRKSKKSNHVCEKCGRNVGFYLEKVVNPYYWDMNGMKIYERMCEDCYESAKGDI
jgi:hypothetical protein